MPTQADGSFAPSAANPTCGGLALSPWGRVVLPPVALIRRRPAYFRAAATGLHSGGGLRPIIDSVEAGVTIVGEGLFALLRCPPPALASVGVRRVASRQASFLRRIIVGVAIVALGASAPSHRGVCNMCAEVVGGVLFYVVTLLWMFVWPRAASEV